jgi:flap endonuclease-1
MGINGFSKFFSEVLVTKDITELSNKVVIVDAIYVIYKYCIAIRNTGKDYINKNGYLSSHLFAIFNLAIFLLKHNITPVFVFDGDVPDIKKNTINERKKRKMRAVDDLDKDLSDQNEYIKNFKKSFHLEELHYYECQLLLKYMGITYIVAPEEADSQCAVLSRLKNYDIGGIISDDSDILVFGGIKLLKNFNIKNKTYSEYNINDILTLMIDKANNIRSIFNMEKINEISQADFIKYCILLGGDYIESIKFLKYDKIFELLVISNFNIDNFFNNLENFVKTNTKYENLNDFEFTEYKNKYIERFNKVYDYYIWAKVFDPYEINIDLRQFNKEKIFELMSILHDFDKSYILNQINNISNKTNDKFSSFKTRPPNSCSFENIRNVSERHNILARPISCR